jgi:hypothetical protein
MIQLVGMNSEAWTVNSAGFYEVRYQIPASQSRTTFSKFLAIFNNQKIIARNSSASIPPESVVSHSVFVSGVDIIIVCSA